MLIYKICPASEYERQKATGEFRGYGIDEKDGYIHLSTKELTEDTLRVWFKGQSDLVVFAVESDGMPNLKWEQARGGQLFPHVYGVFGFDRVLEVKRVQVTADGQVEWLSSVTVE